MWLKIQGKQSLSQPTYRVTSVLSQTLEDGFWIQNFKKQLCNSLTIGIYILRIQIGEFWHNILCQHHPNKIQSISITPGSTLLPPATPHPPPPNFQLVEHKLSKPGLDSGNTLKLPPSQPLTRSRINSSFQYLLGLSCVTEITLGTGIQQGIRQIPASLSKIVEDTIN